MRAAAVTLDLRVEPDAGEAWRYLGYPSAGRMSARALARFKALWPRALSLVSPRGTFRVVTGVEARQAGVPGAAELVAVAVSTIGPALDGEISRCSKNGEMLDAIVLDAIGSAAAEGTADALNLEICDSVRTRGLEAAPRTSPGYGGWETSRQADLLALLPAASVGISLTAGAMMVPRKSVSFAANLESIGTVSRHGSSRCARCHLVNCRHRIAPLQCG